ncbi:hypothetical protein CWI37_2721p0010 [Hamiltosporidium tvaerminnensis]|uniref:Uncharacterized protein n=1 Tax=Hamiltosporidium tvaerminnensis TaxID=1176355 RepID=A0A4Q9KS96_9MICR|nr:hypothetical protein CWI37_2721p0010 [Hamiltosporidium tvaerminnensis]
MNFFYISTAPLFFISALLIVTALLQNTITLTCYKVLQRSKFFILPDEKSKILFLIAINLLILLIPLLYPSMIIEEENDYLEIDTRCSTNIFVVNIISSFFNVLSIVFKITYAFNCSVLSTFFNLLFAISYFFRRKTISFLFFNCVVVCNLFIFGFCFIKNSNIFYSYWFNQLKDVLTYLRK